MAGNSTIEWTNKTWNFVTGCVEVSVGCDHCYARVFAERWRGTPGHPYEQGFDLKLWPGRLELPMRWRKPEMVFVNSMSDILHKDVPDDFIVQAFEVMAKKAPHHIYQILTKRPSRLINTPLLKGILDRIGLWPAHIWMGVSVENQQSAWRIEKLRGLPAPIRFLSCEPLLGPLELDLSGISWLITGAESGHGARPMNEDWVRSLRDQCVPANVKFFYKQNARNGRKIPLPELDGKVWNEFPIMSRRVA